MSEIERSGAASALRPPTLLSSSASSHAGDLRLLSAVEGRKRSARGESPSGRRVSIALIVCAAAAGAAGWWHTAGQPADRATQAASGPAARPASEAAPPAPPRVSGAIMGTAAASDIAAAPIVEVAPSASAAVASTTSPSPAAAAAPQAASSAGPVGAPQGAPTARPAASAPARAEAAAKVRRPAAPSARAQEEVPLAVARQREADVDLLEAMVAHVKGQRPASPGTKKSGEASSSRP